MRTAGGVLAALLWLATVAAEDAGEPPRPAMSAPLAAQSLLLDITHAGERLVAVGKFGHIVVSEDGGAWRQVDAPVSSMLNRVYADAHGRVWTVGHDGVILQSTDSGLTWRVRRWMPEEDRALYDLLFLDGSRGIAVGGYGTYLETDDGGATWHPRDIDAALPGLHFNAIVHLNDGSLFIAGERGLLARSEDQGQTWSLLDSPYTGSFFGALAHGERGVLLYGLRGNVYAADDVADCPTMEAEDWDPFERETVTDTEALAALGWRHLPGLSTEGLFGGAWLADGQALLVGVNGEVALADLLQGRVIPMNTPDNETLNAVLHYEGRWLAVGRRGVRDLGAIAPAGAQGPGARGQGLGEKTHTHSSGSGAYDISQRAVYWPPSPLRGGVEVGRLPGPWPLAPGPTAEPRT